MLLPILLLAWSGIALASPRVKGSPVGQSGRPLPYQQYSYPVPAQQEAGATNKPIFEIVPGSGDNSNSILLKVSPEHLPQLIAQAGVIASESQEYDRSGFQDTSVSNPSLNQVIPNAHFSPPSDTQPDVPSNAPSNVPLNAQFKVPSNAQFNNPSDVPQFSDHQTNVPSHQFVSRSNVQPNYEVRARHNVPHASQYNAAFQGGEIGRKLTGEDLLIKTSIGRTLRQAPGNAQLISTKPIIQPLTDRLVDNYTLIRPNVVDTFRCDNRVYGYYADVDNGCQIFHVCLPLKQIYPANFTVDITYQFSFICPKHTIFSQDSMVCAFEEEALGCEYAPNLYWMNNNFFRKIPKEDGTGEKYANVNTPQQP